MYDLQTMILIQCTCQYHISALEALRNALYKFKTYLLTYLQGELFRQLTELLPLKKKLCTTAQCIILGTIFNLSKSVVTSSRKKKCDESRSQPSGNGGGLFSTDFGLFQDLKIGVPSGCLEETTIFKIIMIDDVTL